MNVTVKITGLEKLRETLLEAGPKLAKRTVRQGLKAGAEIFVDSAKSHAPILKEGTPQRRPGELRDSIDMSIKLSTKEDRGVAHVGPKTTKGGGSEQPGVWGMFVEFGSIHGAAQPYLRPAYEDSKERALAKFTDVMREGMETLRKR